MWIGIGCVVLGYLAGSLSAAIIVCRALGLADPREQGSGNPGATNVLRIGGKKAAAITLLGDLAKGLLPVLLARLLSVDSTLLALTAMAAFLGHVFPVFFGFRGGKGVATAFGAILGLAPMTALVVLAVWLIIARLFRMSSLAALVAAIVAPLVLWWLGAPLAYVAVVLLMGALLVWRHRSNIQRLLSGAESRIGAS